MSPQDAAAGTGPDHEVKAVFSSFEKSYSDSPRAIHEELVRRRAPVRSQWLLPEDAPAPEGIERIAPGTEEARRALSDADYIVSNTYLLQRFDKKPARSTCRPGTARRSSASATTSTSRGSSSSTR